MGQDPPAQDCRPPLGSGLIAQDFIASLLFRDAAWCVFIKLSFSFLSAIVSHLFFIDIAGLPNLFITYLSALHGVMTFASSSLKQLP